MKVMAPGMHSLPLGEAPGQAGGHVAGEAGPDASADVAADVSAVAILDEPARRRIYAHVCAQAGPVGRDDVAHAVDVPRRTAAFHLDRLAERGLLAVTFARRSGRSGPGAGRPAKLYQRSAREVSVSLPPRHYDLAGRLLAGALVEAQQTGEPPREVLDRRARDLGWTWASEQPGPGDLGFLVDLLEDNGYEPQVAAGDVILRNCPFHALAQEHTELVCGMNLHLLEGVLAGLGRTGLQANLDPAPSRCCVRLENSDHPEQP
jgi:predicted ArsR family transcriptional regulator